MYGSMTVSASKIQNESNHKEIVLSQNKKLLLPRCSRRWLIESIKDETYDLKCTNSKIIMKITIRTNYTSMHLSINM